MIAESCQSSSIGTSRIARWIWPVLVLNGLVCLARVPTSAVLKRHRQVEALREQGDVEWLLSRAGLGGADVIRRVRAETPDDAVVVVRGDFHGALEFAPRLLWPRLCCAQHRLPPGAVSLAGRPVAPLAVIGRGSGLFLESR